MTLGSNKVYCKKHFCVWSYIVLLEVAHVADDSNPHQHGSYSKEDAADVVAHYILEKKQGSVKWKLLHFKQICSYQCVPYSGSLF